MRKTILVLATISLLAIPAFAQEDITGPGTTPDSPFYGLDRAVERIRLALARDRVRKARIRLKIAEERLAELKAMTERGKPEFAQRLMRDYESEINETEDDIDAERALGRNVTELAEHVSNVTYKHVLVLERVLEKAPEPARIHIEHAMNVSMRGHERAVASILRRLEEKVERVRGASCETNEDCENLFCPMVIGHDTPICEDGRCKCAGRWNLNETEWKKRFKEEMTAHVRERIQSEIESYNRTEIARRLGK